MLTRNTPFYQDSIAPFLRRPLTVASPDSRWANATWVLKPSRERAHRPPDRQGELIANLRVSANHCRIRPKRMRIAGANSTMIAFPWARLNRDSEIGRVQAAHRRAPGLLGQGPGTGRTPLRGMVPKRRGPCPVGAGPAFMTSPPRWRCCGAATAAGYSDFVAWMASTKISPAPPGVGASGLPREMYMVLTAATLTPAKSARGIRTSTHEVDFTIVSSP
jgi:hypothetical protein